MDLYKRLLHLYPKSFRDNYGKQMCADFEQRRRTVSGPLGMLWFWLDSVADVLINAVLVHLEILKQDLGYTARMLGRTPGFAVTATLVVALGVGATTAAFSVADFVFLRPLPFPQPERLVKLWDKDPEYGRNEISPANYRDWSRMATSFAGMSVYTFNPVNMVGQGDPERLEGVAVTANLFSVLQAGPALGRTFSAEEEQAGAEGTLLLSYGLWQSRFGGDGSVLGRKVVLNDRPYRIIGVMPREFRFPNREVQVWMPIQFQKDAFEERNNDYLSGIARLKPGVSLEQARTEMQVVTRQLEAQYPKENKDHGATMILLRDDLSRQARMLLFALSGAALCVLLITCASLTNLLLARALSRNRELAIRAALGAGRERLVRQLLTESLVIAFLGGALGIMVALAAVPLLSKLVPNTLPIAQQPSLDLHMLTFALLVTALTGIGFGVGPAMRICRESDFSGLHEGVGTGGGRKQRLRSALVMAEVMITVVLLVSCGLLLRAMRKLQAIDPGFRAENVLTLRTALPWPKYEKTAKTEEFYSHVLSRLRALPGVSGAAYVSGLPMVMRGGIFDVHVSGQPQDSSHSAKVAMRFVTPGFFATLGVPVILGRDVSESDTPSAAFAAVVSESFVRRYWPHENPIGRHIDIAQHDRVIVGVVGDVKVRGLEIFSEPQVYLAHAQQPDASYPFYVPKDLVVRSSLPSAALVGEIREIVREADPAQPIANIRPLAEIVDQETQSRSVQVRVLAAFAIISFILAGLGIHGLLSFAVAQRRQEIGIRLALGAPPSHIMHMVLKNAVTLAVAGVVPGMIFAYAVGRAMEALLAGLHPGDLPTFLAAAMLCVLMTISGSLLPTLQAVRVNPMIAIRAE